MPVGPQGRWFIHSFIRDTCLLPLGSRTYWALVVSPLDSATEGHANQLLYDHDLADVADLAISVPSNASSVLRTLLFPNASTRWFTALHVVYN